MEINMVPNEKFKLNVAQGDGQATIQLGGIIDEDANFDKIPKNITNLVVNFKDIKSINSCGVRAWVNIMKELSGSQVQYVDCPPVIVRQLNMVPSFLGHAQVQSVYVPYVCDSCNSEFVIAAKQDQFQPGNVTVPENMNCPSCQKATAETEEPNDLYFAFIK